MAARTLAWALSLLSSTVALADAASIPFGETVEVSGGMSRTDNMFEDGMTMTVYSPKGRTVVVSQNKSPLPGNLVAGFDDLSFIGIGRYSYAVRTNESAADMVARITLPYDIASLSAQRVEQAGLYIGKLADDGRSWVVNPMENFGRLAGMGSLSGEYRLLGRKMTEQTELRRRGVNDISDTYQDLFARTYGPGAGGPPPGPPAGHGPGPAPGTGPLEVTAPGGPGPMGPGAACAPCSCAPAAAPPPPASGSAPPPPPDALSPVPPAGSALPPPPVGGAPPPPPADGGVPPPPPVPVDGTTPLPPGGPAGPSGSPPPPPAGGVPPPAGTLPPPSGAATPPPGGLGPTVSGTPINSASPAVVTTAAAPDLRPGVAAIMGSLGLVMVAHALF